MTKKTILPLLVAIKVQDKLPRNIFKSSSIKISNEIDSDSKKKIILVRDEAIENELVTSM